MRRQRAEALRNFTIYRCEDCFTYFNTMEKIIKHKTTCKLTEEEKAEIINKLLTVPPRKN